MMEYDTIKKNTHIAIPVVPARGGAEVALGIYYKSFLIYRTCMHCAPARLVRACFVRTCCTVVVQEHDLRATPVQCNAKRTLRSYTLHFTLHSSSYLTSSQLFSPRLALSQLFSSHPISSHISSK